MFSVRYVGPLVATYLISKDKESKAISTTNKS